MGFRKSGQYGIHISWIEGTPTEMHKCRVYQAVEDCFRDVWMVGPDDWRWHVVTIIRARYRGGESIEDLAYIYGLSRTNIKTVIATVRRKK